MKKKVVNKILSVVIATSMVASLGACGNSQKSEETTDTSANTTTTATTTETADAATSEEETIINVWHQWSNDTNELKKLYDTAVGEYMIANPNVKINTQTLDTEAYKTKISAEFTGDASGIDVFYYWGAGTAKKLVNADKLLPIDEYITDDVKAKILPGSTSAFEYDGKTYSLPSFSWYMTMFCNQELFDQAGATIPTTYDELLEASKKLSALDGVTPLVAGAKDGWNAAFIYQALAMREVSAENINKMLSGEIPFGEDEGYKAAAEKVLELYNAGAFGKNPLEAGNDDANSAFISGKAGMRIMGSWFANQVYTDDTATINPDKVVACKIPMIDGKGNASDYCGGFIESFWVNKNTKYADEAAKFAIYINEQMGKAAYETGTGFCGWNVELDESALNPLFVQIKDLVAEGQTSVLAWDTSLEANPATVHNEQVQTLFAPDADVDTFIEEHVAAINQ
jgi:raffinose/stachyose/melibiose transport system substrate-binding protein